MPYFLAFVGLVGTLQGVAWIHQGDAVGARARLGVFLAPAGVLLLALGLAWALVPDLFG